MTAAKRLAPFLVAGLLWMGCGDMLLGPDPADTPEENFDVLWKDFDRTYSFFQLKQIDWDAEYDAYRPMVSSQTPNRALFDVMSNMLDELHDLHVNLYAPFAIYGYHNPYDYAPANVLAPGQFAQYVPRLNGNQMVHYGRAEGGVCYVAITSFGGPSSAYALIDQIIREFEMAPGFILDVRENGGGSENRSATIISRFADQRRLYRYVQYRNGPEHDDFTDKIEDYVSPDGPAQFTGPVVVLTNRRSASTSESFTLALRAFPYVTVVGDTTAGGSGNPVMRALPNGWTYRVPRWIEYDPDGNVYENRGLPPDVPVWISPTDSLAGVDTIMQKALDVIGMAAQGKE